MIQIKQDKGVHLQIHEFNKLWFKQYGLCENIDRHNYQYNCLYLALKAGGLSYINLQHLTLTLRNRTIHKCGLTNVCNVLETNIELTSLKDAEAKSRTEHYPAGLEFQGKCNIGLVNHHYLIHDTTDLTAYSLDHYDEVKDIDDCHLIYKRTGTYYNKEIAGTRFIKALKLFKILKHNIGKLITPMPLTEEVMHTQLYDKADKYNTLDCTKDSYTQEKFEETINDIYKILFDLKRLLPEKSICLISVGFIMMTSIRNVLVLIIVLLIC